MPLKPYSGQISTFAGQPLAKGVGIYVAMEAWIEYDQHLRQTTSTVSPESSTKPDAPTYAGTLRVEGPNHVEGLHLLPLDEPYRLTIDDGVSLPIRLRRIEAGEPGSFILEWRSHDAQADPIPAALT